MKQYWLLGHRLKNPFWGGAAMLEIAFERKEARRGSVMLTASAIPTVRTRVISFRTPFLEGTLGTGDLAKDISRFLSQGCNQGSVGTLGIPKRIDREKEVPKKWIMLFQKMD